MPKIGSDCLYCSDVEAQPRDLICRTREAALALSPFPMPYMTMSCTTLGLGGGQSGRNRHAACTVDYVGAIAAILLHA